MTPIDCCKDCHYSVAAYGKLQCLAFRLPKTVEYMRDEKSDCGPNAVMFEHRNEKRYAEFDR